MPSNTRELVKSKIHALAAYPSKRDASTGTLKKLASALGVPLDAST
ncbi:hypothetical protein [Variovorax sp. J22R115]|nr:hypothetical protein [Variovorax sp. J22R115]MDM0050427.1 hypothetical protein [Variovorax sp. J22R115]